MSWSLSRIPTFSILLGSRLSCIAFDLEDCGYPSFSPPMARTLLIDGHNFAFRAFYGITELSRADGFPTNAIHGWLRACWRLEDQEKPDVIRVFFDKGGDDEREKLLPENRVLQMNGPDIKNSRTTKNNSKS